MAVAEHRNLNGPRVENNPRIFGLEGCPLPAQQLRKFTLFKLVSLLELRNLFQGMGRSVGMKGGL